MWGDNQVKYDGQHGGWGGVRRNIEFYFGVMAKAWVSFVDSRRLRQRTGVCSRKK